MPVTYKNRKNQTYYLHQGKTKTGKPKYYFSMRKSGQLGEEIPDGYEIYEHPSNAQVFLRKKQPQLITELEKHLVNKYLKKLKTNRPYIIDIRAETITIFESSHDPDEVSKEGYYPDEILKAYEWILNSIQQKQPNTKPNLQAIINEQAYYEAVLRFTLDNKKTRSFTVERYCFLGSIDDWIYLDGPEHLESLAKKYIKHLGQESFFDLI